MICLSLTSHPFIVLGPSQLKSLLPSQIECSLSGSWNKSHHRVESSLFEQMSLSWLSVLLYSRSLLLLPVILAQAHSVGFCLDISAWHSDSPLLAGILVPQFWGPTCSQIAFLSSVFQFPFHQQPCLGLCIRTHKGHGGICCWDKCLCLPCLQPSPELFCRGTRRPWIEF